MAAGDHGAGDPPALLGGPGAPRARRRLRLARAHRRRRPRAGLRATPTSTGRSTTFSGGELTRASLARALAGDPDLPLLDEPTNHLDMASLEWLERELATLDAAVILVAHDRWFLEAVADLRLELEPRPGDLLPRQVARVARGEGGARGGRGPLAERQAGDLERLERFVARFRYGTKARQAQSKLKQLDRIRRESVEAPRGARGARPLGFEFLNPPRSGRTVVEARALDLARGRQAAAPRPPRSRSSAASTRPSSARTAPARRRCSRRSLGHARQPRAVRVGHGVEAAYFSQHSLELDERGSRARLRRSARPGLKRPQAQALLGRFLFSGWRSRRSRSGALGRRAAAPPLALVVASGANFLVLDEPTNHLDLESREALEAALEAFPGTVLLVSHDRALLDAVARAPSLVVEDGALARSGRLGGLRASG